MLPELRRGQTPLIVIINNVTGSADNAVDGKSAIGQSKGLGFGYNNYRTNNKL